VSTPSPGPGWWLASDGKWYPQQWETCFISCTNESLEAVIAEASHLTNTHGEQGWEIVGSSMQRTQVTHRFKEYDRGGDLYFEWSVICTLKRPLAPGSKKGTTGDEASDDSANAEIAATVVIEPEPQP
jgi:hypothetical protein